MAGRQGKSDLPRRVELLRVSGGGQGVRDTPADQRKALDDLRARRPCRVVERIDIGAKGLSGALPLEQRPDLIRLRELSEARAYDEVAVRHLDRLTRHTDPLERALILSMVARADAVIVEADGSVLDPRTQVGELTWVMRTLASADERLKIRERTVTARKRLAAQGQLQGRAPYARRWDKKTKKWSIVEAEARIYRRIFEEIIAGVSTYALADKLNAENVPTPLKRKYGWVPGKISSLLYNRSAIGEITSCGINLKCPAIVDTKTFNRAHAALRDDTRAGRPPSKPWVAMFRGVLVCGVCGSRVWVMLASKRSSGKQYSYYMCRARATARNVECKRMHHVPKVDADGREKLLQLLATDISPAVGAVEGNPAETIKSASDQLAKLDQEERRLLRAVRKASNPEAIEEALTELAGEIKAAKASLETARAAETATQTAPVVDRKRREKLLAAARSANAGELRELVAENLRWGDAVLTPHGQVVFRANAPFL